MCYYIGVGGVVSMNFETVSDQIKRGNEEIE